MAEVDRGTMVAKKANKIGKEVISDEAPKQLNWLESQAEIIKELKAKLEARADEIQDLQADVADKDDEIQE